MTVTSIKGQQMENIRVIKKGTVELRTIVVNISDVHYPENLADNIMSYGRLEMKGVYLERHDGRSYMVQQKSGLRVLEVYRRHNVLMIDAMGESDRKARIHAVMSPLKEAVALLDDIVTETTLLILHKRLGHISYDTVERMADTRGSGIRLTSRSRLNCLTCAQGKQSRNNRSKKDTGANAPIDKIGGVIGSDIKGPMTPKDRRGNRYLINFVDYSTHYVGVFLAKNKVKTTKKLEHFLVYFEKRFNCRIHVLRTDGGKEYTNVDPFCKATGVHRQISERENQASNGKAERMLRTVLNMARCMLFASGLHLYFWGDAVKYAAYVLNRSSCRTNAKRKSPLEMLTRTVSNLPRLLLSGVPVQHTEMLVRRPGNQEHKLV